MDRNLVSARNPDDIPAFNRPVIALFAQYGSATGADRLIERRQIAVRRGFSLGRPPATIRILGNETTGGLLPIHSQ